MKQFFMYILLCSDGSYYTGITNNLQRRLAEHNSGYNAKSYTHNRRPVKLVYAEVFPKPMPAIRREKQIKKWSHAKKTALIEANTISLQNLASCRNETRSDGRNEK